MIMSANTGTIMTIANSIIGVSVLAMPFCFKECGILLSIIMLILSSILSRLTCYLLLKSAVLARRRNFEHLAFYIFGPTGKFIAELSIIGFLMGTCIAFFVVVGDLGPAIISKTLDINNSAALRPSVLIGLALIVVLPLGLLRNVDSLSSICTATIGFYLCLVLKVIFSALPNLMSGVWIDRVHYWRPAGVLQCLPIFSMALFCQTQLFEIYESLPNASFERMNGAVRAAINLCTGVYISVGFFGYIAFFTQNFGGNILMSFAPSLMSEIMKVGFVLSVAVSFPLVIFPCRASLNSLLFKRLQTGHYHDTIGTFIPEARFKCITIFIISFSLVLGLLIPNIELVLGLVGSTIGVGICVMFPALAFIFLSTKETADRIMAQFLLFVGIMILVLGTYATLYAANETGLQDSEPKTLLVTPFNLPVVDNAVEKKVVEKIEVKLPMVAEIARKEPPVPVDPIVDKILVVEEKPDEKPLLVVKEVAAKISEEVIHKDALEKEDEELADAEKQADKAKDEKTKELFMKLEKHEEEQKKLLQEQKEIIQELKEQNKEEKKEAPAVNAKHSESDKELENVISQVLKVQETADKKDKEAPVAVKEAISQVLKVQEIADQKQDDSALRKLPDKVVDKPSPKMFVPSQPIAYQQRFKTNETKQGVEEMKEEKVKVMIKSIIMPSVVAPKQEKVLEKVNESADMIVKKMVKAETSILKTENQADKIVNVDVLREIGLDEAKAMRRDILGAGDLIREKRDVSEEPMDNRSTQPNESNCPVTSTPEEIPSNEPIIKVGSHLSDLILSSKDNELEGRLEAEVIRINEIKPMKRDLKSVNNQQKIFTSLEPEKKNED